MAELTYYPDCMTPMFKRLSLPILFIICINEFTYSQTNEIKSKPIIEIFSDFHVSLDKGGSGTTGFSLNRAYFGYNYAFDNNFFVVIILNAGYPNDLASGSKPRRYAFFREASMNYTNDRLNLTMGMVKTKLYLVQQGFWGMRYIAKPFQDLNGYGMDSDLGLEATYKFSDMFEADLSLLNGEGGGNLQLDNNLKYSAGITFKPSEKIAVRVYDDWMKNAGIWQNTALLFAGYKTESFFLGAEINYKANLDTIIGHNAWGISATGGISISKKSEIFARYDYATSVIPDGDAIKWNQGKDNSFFIVGVQHAFSGSVKVAIDYQSTFPEDKSKPVSHLIFFNATLKI